MASQVFDFTQEVQDVMATTLLAGTNIVITYDDLGNTIRIDASNGATGTVTGTGVAGRVAF